MEKQGYLITREMVYGTETPQIREDGYEMTGEFQPGRPEDIILCPDKGRAMLVISPMRPTEPRIILRKKRVRKVVFTQVGERPAALDEWVELQSGAIVMVRHSKLTDFPYPIFTREEVFE